jgi:hypothetical protein
MEDEKAVTGQEVLNSVCLWLEALMRDCEAYPKGRIRLEPCAIPQTSWRRATSTS